MQTDLTTYPGSTDLTLACFLDHLVNAGLFLVEVWKPVQDLKVRDGGLSVDLSCLETVRLFGKDRVHQRTNGHRCEHIHVVDLLVISEGASGSVSPCFLV